MEQWAEEKCAAYGSFFRKTWQTVGSSWHVGDAEGAASRRPWVWLTGTLGGVQWQGVPWFWSLQGAPGEWSRPQGALVGTERRAQEGEGRRSWKWPAAWHTLRSKKHAASGVWTRTAGQCGLARAHVLLSESGRRCHWQRGRTSEAGLTGSEG